MSGRHTRGPWMVATSNSWRRIVGYRGESICEPIKQSDGHPDLYFRNGGDDGPDARLLAASPELLSALKDLIRFRNWELAEGGVPPGDLINVWKDAEAAIAKAEPSTLPTTAMQEAGR